MRWEKLDIVVTQINLLFGIKAKRVELILGDDVRIVCFSFLKFCVVRKSPVGFDDLFPFEL